ncbi:MAG: cobalamin-binding protein [Candidatus Omnitrophica bacterium]|nr:cobalamin-binding protein [Candidatus Omnitrophota bacterium]
MKTLKYFAVLLLICSIIGCQGKTSSSSSGPRIISLAPSITEILFALGLEKNIVGITTCCDYPPMTKRIEKVATFSGQANLERILILKPDIVFSTGLEQAPLVEKIENLGLRVVLVHPKNLNQLFAGILEIGELTKRKEEAKSLVLEMKEKIKKIKERVMLLPDEQRPKVFVEICSDPLMTAGAGSFVDELITLAGGNNIAKDAPRPYSQFSPELVVKRNPDYIILSYMQPEKETPCELIAQRIGWRNIKAVKNGQIITDINPDLFLRPGPRIVQGLEQIHLSIFR